MIMMILGNYDEDYYFYCDNGNMIYSYYVNNGWDDCGDNSDEDDLYIHSFYGFSE